MSYENALLPDKSFCHLHPIVLLTITLYRKSMSYYSIIYDDKILSKVCCTRIPRPDPNLAWAKPLFGHTDRKWIRLTSRSSYSGAPKDLLRVVIIGSCPYRSIQTDVMPRPGIQNFDTFITMTSQWTRWRLKSPTSPLFTQPFIGAQIKENIKAPRHWPLCGEFTGDQWIPRTNGQ